jgi:hypothetical protein
VQLLGNERVLAHQLRVPMPELLMWLRGEEEPPQIVFLRAVDLLTDQGAPNGADIPPVQDARAENPKNP